MLSEYDDLMFCYDFQSVLVGAPKDNYNGHNSSGALYKCPLSLDSNDCALVKVNFTPTTSNDECKFQCSFSNKKILL